MVKMPWGLSESVKAVASSMSEEGDGPRVVDRVPVEVLELTAAIDDRGDRPPLPT
jgi:hypothetical protein